MAEIKKLNVELIQSVHPIGKTIYVPQRDKATKTKIRGYEAEVGKDEGKLIGAVFKYTTYNFFFLRNGVELDMTTKVPVRYGYTNKKEAQKASRFLKVEADDETWRLAIGDREVEDPTSPYHIDNCGFPSCCGNISEARDILLFCKSKGGLMVQYRDELSDLISSNHDFGCGDESPLGKIFRQLEMQGE